LDNFHASHSVMDDWSGRKFRPRCDASIAGVGNNFDSHEFGVPAYIVKLTISAKLEQKRSIQKRESEPAERATQYILVSEASKKEGRTKEVYEEVCNISICGEPGDI
jgi:hypothetical protein